MQVDHRVIVRQLPYEEEREGEYRGDGERHDEGRGKPVEVLALVEHELQRTDPDDEQREPDAVDRRLHARRLALAVDDPRHGERDEAHRHVDVENPRPGKVVGDPAAKQRSDYRRDQDGERERGEGDAGLLARIGRKQKRLRERNHRPGDRALDHAEEDEHRHRDREAAEERGHDEERGRGEEEAHLAEALRQPAGERHRDRVGDRERGDDPGALRRADAEVAGDRRDRDVGDRRVEDVHERRQRQRDRAEDELCPLQGRGLRRRGRRGLRRPRRSEAGGGHLSASRSEPSPGPASARPPARAPRSVRARRHRRAGRGWQR